MAIIKIRNTSDGFTLIEVLVSVGIIALVMTVLAQGFFSLFRTNIKTELLKDVKQNGDFALDVMGRMIRNSKSVATTCSLGGTTTASFSVVNQDGFTTTFGCLQDATIPRIASTSGTRTDYLTSRNVSLGINGCTNAVTFVCTRLISGQTSVKITFTLGQVGTPPDQFAKANSSFQTSVMTRQ
ncbi:prepilin-type N-terminal cleavage/methylation domain-containing protein [Candidatus Gottesmanbacteria bacterium]|nr:prepilin-type N-terminal cleavage/methylation domain-containing protein [Candidatus Gottesmanbacteria bacterium]